MPSRSTHLADHDYVIKRAELDALEDDLAFESVAGESEAIPSYLREDIHETLPDLVDEAPKEVGLPRSPPGPASCSRDTD